MAQVLNAPPSLLPSATYAGKAGNPSPNNFWFPEVIPNPLDTLSIANDLTAGSIYDLGSMTGHNLTVNGVAPGGFALGVPASLTQINGTAVNVEGQINTNASNPANGMTTRFSSFLRGACNFPNGWICGTNGGQGANNTFNFPSQAGMGSLAGSIALADGDNLQVIGNKCIVNLAPGTSANVTPDSRLFLSGQGCQGIPYAVSYDQNVPPASVIDTAFHGDGTVLLTNSSGSTARFGVFWF